MIIWLTGKTGSGKTTLAKKLKGINTIILDEDDMYHIWPDLDCSPLLIREFNIRMARLAKYLEEQGNDVIVAATAPYEDLRYEIKDITGCMFMYLDHEEPCEDIELPYEPAFEADMIMMRHEDENRRSKFI